MNEVREREKELLPEKSKDYLFLFPSLTTAIGLLGTSRLIVIARLIRWKHLEIKTQTNG